MEVSSTLASLAFGIPIKELGGLIGKSLVITPLANKNVRICLRPSAENWQKGLWGKVLDDLNEELIARIESKQKKSKAKKTYEFLCLVYQASVQGRGETFKRVKPPQDLSRDEDFMQFWEQLKSGKADLEGNREFLQGLLCCLWQGLSERARNEVISPVQIRNSLGILNSGE